MGGLEKIRAASIGAGIGHGPAPMGATVLKTVTPTVETIFLLLIFRSVNDLNAFEPTRDLIKVCLIMWMQATEQNGRGIEREGA